MGVIMKYIHQFLIIITISFIGELLSILLPFPIPASVYGLIIMLICLFTKIIKLNQIEETADWLILIMPLLFVPSAVSLINVADTLLQDILIISVITLVSTIVVMLVTGKIAQSIIERKEQNKNGLNIYRHCIFWKRNKPINVLACNKNKKKITVSHI